MSNAHCFNGLKNRLRIIGFLMKPVPGHIVWMISMSITDVDGNNFCVLFVIVKLPPYNIRIVVGGQHDARHSFISFFFANISKTTIIIINAFHFLGQHTSETAGRHFLSP